MHFTDTIVALSSPAGNAPRMVVRLSGGIAIDVAKRWAPALDATAGVHHTQLHTRFGLVAGQCWTFLAPRSYTGEDLVELHLPGNSVLAQWMLDDAVQAGARLAEPGEFTARAYFNGRMDLAQAEGVALSIATSNKAQLSAARKLLAGELSRRLRPVLDDATEMLALVEAGIDFTDEGIVALPADELRRRSLHCAEMLDQLLANAGSLEQLAHEPMIVLAGRQSAGKSTLLNALLGRERAVVSDAAGTTRDALSGELTLQSGMVRLVDVAGLFDADDAPSGTPNAIAEQMRSQAWRSAEQADVLVRVWASDDTRPPIDLPRTPDLTVRSKADLAEVAGLPNTPSLNVSVLQDTGMDELRQRLNQLAFAQIESADLALSTRHLEAIARASASLEQAANDAEAGDELSALALREAVHAIGDIFGGVSADDVLGKIFSGFCIGK